MLSIKCWSSYCYSVLESRTLAQHNITTQQHTKNETNNDAHASLFYCSMSNCQCCHHIGPTFKMIFFEGHSRLSGLKLPSKCSECPGLPRTKKPKPSLLCLRSTSTYKMTMLWPLPFCGTGRSWRFEQWRIPFLCSVDGCVAIWLLFGGDVMFEMGIGGNR